MNRAGRLWEAAGQARQVVLDALFPPRCIGCGLVGTWACEPCRSILPVIGTPICARCGRAQASATTRCADCVAFPPVLRQLRAAFRYEGAIRDALHRLKYNGIMALAQPLVDLAWPYYARLGWTPEVIVPVPLHPRRQRERGYNQALVLAQALGDRAGVPVAPSLLRKIRHTRSQVQVGTREERRSNVAGAFAAVPVPGLRFLLVDDLATTGSTLASAATALRAAGAREVRAFTIAREC